MPRTAKPEKLGPDRWRIRWHDHTGNRRSKVYTNFDDAQRALRARQTTADEVRHGLRPKPPGDHTFDELATYELMVPDYRVPSDAKDARRITLDHVLRASTGNGKPLPTRRQL